MSGASRYLDPPGEQVVKADLLVSNARDLVRILRPGELPFCRLLECRRVDGSRPAEVVVLEVEVGVGQYPKNDIRRHERVAAVFREDAAVPEALALRSDFPFVPHLNSLDSGELPRSLCLYDESYHELKLTWTSIAFVERIREWLALTARGELHAEDQPLEPLLVGSPMSIVLPPDLFGRNEETPALLAVRAVEHEGKVQALIASRADDERLDRLGLRYVAIGIVGEPQEHGVIRMTPTSLRQLHDFLKSARLDFLGELRRRLELWRGREDLRQLMDLELVLVVALPKKRSTSDSVEVSDAWAFICKETADKLSERLGVLLGADETELLGEDVELLPLNVNYALSRGKAAELSGAESRKGKKIVAVGVGALGSQASDNLLRTGYGEWTFIDPDQLLPHNLTKHKLTGRDVGRPKAYALAETANETIDGTPIATSIVADVLTPGEHTEAVEEALINADIILDASASVAVARHLARDLDSPARRVSLYFNPSGTAGVMLCEDVGRESPLDWLEMLYYRELINVPKLEAHLRRPPGRVRYGRSCRDLSSTLPQDLVALHAAVGARALRTSLDVDTAAIAIWQTNEENLGVEHVKVAPTAVIERQFDEWTVLMDQWLLDKVTGARLDKLPNETGGVLTGAHDTQRKILYLVDALPSPPDSTEWPSLYVRGSRGLARRIEEIKQITDGQLNYAGEWHSHPPGYGPTPSDDDRKVFTWLEKHLSLEGLPAAILIVGENNSALYVGGMP